MSSLMSPFDEAHITSYLLFIETALYLFRLTLRQSRPNKAGHNCPSVCTSVRAYIRPSTKFLRFQWNLACS